MKNILFAASECVPFAKTGGLGDVVGTLPNYLPKDEFDARVILPNYKKIDKKYKDQMTEAASFPLQLGPAVKPCRILTLTNNGVQYYFVDNDDYFGSDEFYDGMPWDLGRFAFYSKAVLECLQYIGFTPDIIHCNDWQSGLVPVYLDAFYKNIPDYSHIRTIMTIHNLKFQGTWDIPSVMSVTGLPSDYFTMEAMEFHGNANLLKGGLVYADRISTVSETYANEILMPFYGEGLDGLLTAHRDKLCGIVNGIDYLRYDPQNDPQIHTNYCAADFRKKKPKNKAALQKELGLKVDPHILMIGLISRLTDQKGIDLIGCMADELCNDNIQLVILGNGDPRYEEMFKYMAAHNPEKVSASIMYDDALSHRIYSSVDAFLMPSQFEPCGLSQLMAMRYGTVPIVRETGGLKDTVQPYNEYEHNGTGFSFANFNAHEMMGTIRYAERIYYYKKRDWNNIAQRAMEKDFSWDASVRKYEKLYNDLTEA